MRTKREVHEGRVQCPKRGEVDVETCFGCIDVTDVIDDGKEGAIVCVPGGIAHTRDERLAIRW